MLYSPEGFRAFWFFGLYWSSSTSFNRCFNINLPSMRISSYSTIFKMIDLRVQCHYRLLESLSILINLFSWSIIYILWWTIWEITPIIYISKGVFISSVTYRAFWVIFKIITLIHLIHTSQRWKVALIMFISFFRWVDERCPVIHVSLIHNVLRFIF